MTALDIVILAILIILLAIWVGIYVHRASLKNLRQELKSPMDQSEWYDEEGNHIYYDRKIIRYRQRQKQKAATMKKE